jgi:hypothetical protein
MVSATQPHASARQFQTEAHYCEEHGLELEAAIDYGWVVRTASGDHFGHVVGCVDQLRDSVELLRLDGGFHWSTFATLHEALDNLVANPQHNRVTDANWRCRLPVMPQTESVAE